MHVLQEQIFSLLKNDILSLVFVLPVKVIFITCLFIFKAETEVLVESGNVDVVNKMIVSGYDVKVSEKCNLNS